MSTAPRSYRRAARSLRLSFRFEQGAITLFDRREVGMRSLPSNGLETWEPGTRSGSWVEVRDGRGVVLYRRGMQHPMIRRSEAFADDGTASVRLWAPPRGAFTVVVPTSRDGVDVVVFASAVELPDVPGPASEILRVPLWERPSGPAGPDNSHEMG